MGTHHPEVSLSKVSKQLLGSCNGGKEQRSIIRDLGTNANKSRPKIHQNRRQRQPRVSAVFHLGLPNLTAEQGPTLQLEQSRALQGERPCSKVFGQRWVSRDSTQTQFLATPRLLGTKDTR